MKTDLVVTGFIFNDHKLLLIHHKKLNTWLPVGGHIEPNETPEEALRREIREETGLNIVFPKERSLPLVGTLIRNCPTPFHINVHSVGDHNHCSLDFVCIAQNPEALRVNDEVSKPRWVSEDELRNDSAVRQDIRNIALEAFKEYKRKK